MEINNTTHHHHQKKKILVANRGEIAARIIRSCHLAGYATIAIVGRGDELSPHKKLATENVKLDGVTLADTYLNMDKIVSIAKEYGVWGVHPGYGFLSENGEFAEKVERAGLVFIGPRPENIKLMGDKILSKEKVKEFGVPCVPSFSFPNIDDNFKLDATLIKKIASIGFPLLVKAAAGGGGKGMRLVEREQDLEEAVAQATREAKKAFRDGRVFIEKYITKPRHIEVQVLGDGRGEAVHLFERECSIQRRHQKIVEEAPSPVMPKNIRSQMLADAVNMSKGISYRGVGTVEFIVDDKFNYYFLEMNTRLQVEHPVTELITGLDLVQLQLSVAEGRGIPEKLINPQSPLKVNGHALEVRIYAEDPDNGFLPTIGKVAALEYPQGPYVRFDTYLIPGMEVGLDYDPMLGKLVVWGEDRACAIERMCVALDELVILGLKTNQNYLKRVMLNANYRKGETQTNFVEVNRDSLKKSDFLEERGFNEENLASLIIGARLLSKKYLNNGANTNSDLIFDNPFDLISNFRNV